MIAPARYSLTIDGSDHSSCTFGGTSFQRIPHQEVTATARVPIVVADHVPIRVLSRRGLRRERRPPHPQSEVRRTLHRLAVQAVRVSVVMSCYGEGRIQLRRTAMTLRRHM